MQSQVNKDKVYEELDLTQEGLTEEEILRRKTRLFVGGLKFTSEDRVLEEYFSKFGDIKEAIIIRDRNNGCSKGYGFVTMRTHESSLKATINKSPKLDGRKCNVNFAYIGEKKKKIKEKLSSSNQMQMFNHYSLKKHFIAPCAITLFTNQYCSALPAYQQPNHFFCINAIEEQIYKKDTSSFFKDSNHFTYLAPNPSQCFSMQPIFERFVDYPLLTTNKIYDSAQQDGYFTQ
ncbi:RNA-binding protein 38 isoform X2 [Hydra vulgaris]|uniref:RNA-binding protein 38 isoform X2 n=1 Tax=Hydra vulgaris TaxID=6087 RepID=A0ABM4BST2_HYDVU